MAVTGIRNRLKSVLLENPRPQEKGAYRATMPALFPSIERIRAFLSMSNSEDQTEFARDIVFDLLRAGPFAPSSRLMMNLLDFEARQLADGQESVTGYVPQDHFVHLVNLYLLGVYLYGYHAPLHRQCKLHLNRLRNAAVRLVRSEQPEVCEKLMSTTEYELFARYWGSFVLLHDIGYPGEGVAPSERFGEAIHGNLKPYANVRKGLVKDVALKALAHAMALDIILGEDESVRLRDYLDHMESVYLVGESGDAGPEDVIAVFKDHDDGSSWGALSGRDRDLLSAKWGGARHYPARGVVG